MTKPISRKMAVAALLNRFYTNGISVPDNVRGSRCLLLCPICNIALLPDDDIQFDHTHADVFDGPHVYHNLRPIHAACHKIKTAKDIAANAKVKRIQAGGRKKRGPKIKSPGFRKDITKKMSGKVVKRGK